MVDDATETVAQTVFHTTEGTRGYLVLLEGLGGQRGGCSAAAALSLRLRALLPGGLRPGADHGPLAAQAQVGAPQRETLDTVRPVMSMIRKAMQVR